MPLPMEVKQEARRAHGFLGFGCFKHFSVQIDRNLYSTNCGVELPVSRFSFWRSLSCILYCPVWVKFGSGEKWPNLEIFQNGCWIEPVQLAHNEVRHQTGPGGFTFEVEVPTMKLLPFSKCCSWTFCKVVSVGVREQKSLYHDLVFIEPMSSI